MWGCGGRRKGQRQGRRARNKQCVVLAAQWPIVCRRDALAFDHALRSMEVKVPWRVHAWELLYVLLGHIKRPVHGKFERPSEEQVTQSDAPLPLTGALTT